MQNVVCTRPEHLFCSRCRLLSIYVQLFRCQLGRQKQVTAAPATSGTETRHTPYRHIDLHLTNRLDIVKALVPEVRIIQFGVMASLQHQRVVVAFFDNLPRLQHNDAVGMHHC